MFLIIPFLSPKAQTIDATNHTVTISSAQEYVNFACWYGYTDKYKTVGTNNNNFADITVKLDADIYLDDPSIVIPEGSTSKNHTIHSFRGEFDGQNHAVYGLDSCMFDYFVASANVHNLIIREANIQPHGASSYIGLIGEIRTNALSGTNSVSIDHVIIENSSILTENSSTCVGAIVGKIDKKSSASSSSPLHVLLKDCFVKDVKIHTKNHSLTNDTIVGGFVGFIETDWTSTAHMIAHIQHIYLERCSINNIEFVHEDATDEETKNFEAQHHFFGNHVVKYNNETAKRLRYCYYGHYNATDGATEYTSDGTHWSEIASQYPDITEGRTEVNSSELTMYIYHLLMGEMGGLVLEQYTKDYYGIYGDYDGTDYRQGQILLLLQDSVQNGVLTVRNKAFLPIDLPNDDYFSQINIVKELIIAEKGSLIDNRTEEYAHTGATVLKNLTVGQWNFVGPSLTKNNIGDVFNDCQTQIVEQDGEYVHKPTYNDVAVLPYNSSINDWGNYLYASDNMTAGKGYFVWVFDALQENEEDATKTALSAGETSVLQIKSNFIQDNVINIDDQRGGSTNGDATKGYWVFMSNPYPATINAKQFLFDNKTEQIQGQDLDNNIYGTLYVYRDNSWVANIGDAFEDIYHSEGFAIGYADEGTTNLSINKPTKYGFATSKSSNASKLMQFVSKANDSERKAFANISQNADNGFDIMDAYVMISTNRTDFVEPYFNVDEHWVLKNAFRTLPYVCDINFHASQISNTEFTVENVPDDVEVSIIDIENDNTETIISDGTVFNFVAQAGENEGRYKIKFVKKNNSVNDVANQDNTIVINNNNNILRVSGQNLKQIQLTNVLGQTLINENINADSYNKTLDLPKGTYIVKVKSANGINTQKILIQ